MGITVIIPCYNAAQWIEQALQSVASQSHLPEEVIVIDDGSCDDSIQRVKCSPVPVKLLMTAHVGGAGARNVGISAAEEEWIAFLDADDVWHPDHLERADRLLQNSKDVAYLAHYDLIDSVNRREQRAPERAISHPVGGLSHQKFLEQFAKSPTFGMSSVLVRRDRLREVNQFDETQIRRHDIDMWLRVIEGQTWSYDPVAAYAYRIDTPGAISRNIASREYFHLRALLKNREGYSGPTMERLIVQGARRCVSAAFTDGNAQDQRLARELAWPHLLPKDRRLFGMVSGCPFIFRWANQMRRRILGHGL